MNRNECWMATCLLVLVVAVNVGQAQEKQPKTAPQPKILYIQALPPSPEMATVMITLAHALEACRESAFEDFRLTMLPTPVTSPCGAISASSAARSPSAESIGWSDGANLSRRSANCPFLAMSMTASAAPAGDALI